MKKFLILLFAFVIGINATFAQNILGAWEYNAKDSDLKTIKTVATFTNGYYVMTSYSSTGEFISSQGGSWSTKDNMLSFQIEFDNLTPENVGTTLERAVVLKKNRLTINGKKFKRIDDGGPGALPGAWLMSGRKRNGELRSRDTSRSRKTMKILSGTRFQWIAYNTETKQFLATGGGTYTTIDGTYTENIEFFSRDASRVGMRLGFTYELIDGDWHHSGKSSKGAPIYEIWSQRN